MLDQHFPHIGGRYARIDGFLRVGEKFFRSVFEGGIDRLRLFNHAAQGRQNCRQICLELHNGLPKFRNLWPLICKEEIEQVFQSARVTRCTAQDLVTILDQNGGRTILKNDIVSRIALFKFLLDFLV